MLRNEIDPQTNDVKLYRGLPERLLTARVVYASIEASTRALAVFRRSPTSAYVDVGSALITFEVADGFLLIGLEHLDTQRELEPFDALRTFDHDPTLTSFYEPR